MVFVKLTDQLALQEGVEEQGVVKDLAFFLGRIGCDARDSLQRAGEKVLLVGH